MYKTTISKITTDDMIIRGEKHSSLLTGSFSDAIFLILASRKPTETESKIFNAMLVAVIDHGMGTTSAITTRAAMSGSHQLSAAVAAGIASIGKFHGGAIEAAMHQFTELAEISDMHVYVRNKLRDKNVIYGYGHKVYKNEDPRVKKLLSLCKTYAFNAPSAILAQKLEDALAAEKGKRLILNIDGLLGALLLDMGFEPAQGNALFIIARTPGLVAHALEAGQEKPVQRIPEDAITYVGK